MRANRITFILLLVFFAELCVVYSCKKAGDSNDCNGLVAANITNPIIFLEFKNSQAKDLLDPATAGHLDTAYIKKQNPWLTINPLNGSPLKLTFYYLQAGQNKILVLSPTARDTLNITMQMVTDKCNMYTKLSEFKYNGLVLKPDSGTYSTFLVRK